jgi:hypothetical protein
MIPASYVPGPSARGAGAICVGQIRSKSAMSSLIRSGAAATIRSCWCLICIVTSAPSSKNRAHFVTGR